MICGECLHIGRAKKSTHWGVWVLALLGFVNPLLLLLALAISPFACSKKCKRCHSELIFRNRSIMGKELDAKRIQLLAIEQLELDQEKYSSNAIG